MAKAQKLKFNQNSCSIEVDGVKVCALRQDQPRGYTQYVRKRDPVLGWIRDLFSMLSRHPGQMDELRDLMKADPARMADLHFRVQGGDPGLLIGVPALACVLGRDDLLDLSLSMLGSWQECCGDDEEIHAAVYDAHGFALGAMLLGAGLPKQLEIPPPGWTHPGIFVRHGVVLDHKWFSDNWNAGSGGLQPKPTPFGLRARLSGWLAACAASADPFASRESEVSGHVASLLRLSLHSGVHRGWSENVPALFSNDFICAVLSAIPRGLDLREIFRLGDLPDYFKVFQVQLSKGGFVGMSQEDLDGISAAACEIWYAYMSESPAANVDLLDLLRHDLKEPEGGWASPSKSHQVCVQGASRLFRDVLGSRIMVSGRFPLELSVYRDRLVEIANDVVASLDAFIGACGEYCGDPPQKPGFLAGLVMELRSMSMVMSLSGIALPVQSGDRQAALSPPEESHSPRSGSLR